MKIIYWTRHKCPPRFSRHFVEEAREIIECSQKLGLDLVSINGVSRPDVGPIFIGFKEKDEGPQESFVFSAQGGILTNNFCVTGGRLYSAPILLILEAAKEEGLISELIAEDIDEEVQDFMNEIKRLKE